MNFCTSIFYAHSEEKATPDGKNYSAGFGLFNGMAVYKLRTVSVSPKNLWVICHDAAWLVEPENLPSDFLDPAVSLYNRPKRSPDFSHPVFAKQSKSLGKRYG